MDDLRNGCPMRHENGNCTVIGGFCIAVNDPICVGLHNAYDSGYRTAAIHAQQERENPEQITNADRIRAMSDEELVVFLDGFSSRCLDCAEDAKNQSCPIYKGGHFAGHKTSWNGSNSQRTENKNGADIKASFGDAPIVP